MLGSPRVMCFVEQKKLVQKQARKLRGYDQLQRMKNQNLQTDHGSQVNLEYSGNGVQRRKVDNRDLTPQSDENFKSDATTIAQDESRKNLNIIDQKQDQSIEEINGRSQIIHVPQAMSDAQI